MKRLSLLALSALLSAVIVRAVPAAVPPAAENAAGNALPAAFVTATETLFADGMSDPRGGVYRSITVRVGDVWSGKGTDVAIHGWVMPSQLTAEPKRAVAWNGLTYAVLSDTGPADLAADVESVFPRSTLSEGAPDKSLLMRRASISLSEDASLDVVRLAPIKASLLLRLGEKSLASEVYAAWLAGVPARPNSDDHEHFDPFDRMAGDWAWAAFDRSVCAHMRGDDRLALADASLLAAVGPQLEVQAAEHGIARPLSMNRTDPPRPYFEFLQQVPELAADSRRRLAAPEASLDLAKLQAAHKSRSERIAVLISHLDDIAARQDGQPGGVGLDTDPIGEALIQEGDAAVDSLLDVMQNDKRLTRSVSFGRDFFRQRNLLSVRSAAGACIARILHTTEFGANSRPSVEEIRAYWNANRGVPLAERWYRTLNDDSATPRQWLEAAQNIVQPADVERKGMWMTIPTRAVGAPQPPMRGASLRSRTSPLVSELLIRRVTMLVGSDPIPTDPNSANQWISRQLYEGTTLGLILAEWDLKAAQTTLKLLMNRIRSIGPNAATTGIFDQVGPWAASVTIVRLRGGMPDAASDYVAFLNGISPSYFGFRFDRIFAPICEYPSDPVLAHAAEVLFNDSKSLWNPVSQPETGAASSRGTYGRDELIGSQLLCIPAFRKQVLRELDDQRVAGTCTVRSDSQVEWKRNGSSGTYGSTVGPGETSVLNGTPTTFRLCDLYAWKLSGIRAPFPSRVPAFGIPRFELYWPQNERDVAILSLKAYLTRYGDDLKSASGNASLLAFYTDSGINIRFPDLNHAATPDDVRVGRAIFSLAEPPARPVLLASNWPISARWVGENAPRELVWIRSKDGSVKSELRAGIEGEVHQAEEALEGGKWCRYYGFVGPHIMARVPADEIVLLDGSGRPIPTPAVSGRTTH